MASDRRRATLDLVRAQDPDLIAAAAEVDRSLLHWFRGLSLRERLDASTRTSATLAGFRRVPTGAR